MELGTLLTKFNQSKSHSPEQFLALSIGSETVHSTVWHLETGQAKIVSVGSIEEWNGDETKLVTAADNSLATALEPIEKEPDKIIFGLPESWITDDKISPERQSILKELVERLSLQPIGFVVITEALIHWLKHREGTPPTAILLELSETDIIVTLVKVGKSLGSQVVGRSEDLGADVEEGLARFTQTDSLPSRMIIYDGHLDLEAARQTLLSYAWQDKLPFLHFPKMELLDKDVIIRAVSYAAGTDTGVTVSEAEEPANQPPNPQSVGFYPETDVVKSPAESIPAPKSQPPMNPLLPKQPSPSTIPPEHLLHHTMATPRMQVHPHQAPLPQPTDKIKTMFVNSLQQLRLFLTTIKPKRLSLAALVIVVGLVIIIAGGVGAYWAIPQAKVTLYVTPQSISQTLQISLDPSKDTDLDKKLLSAQVIELEVEDSLEKETTGESEVGEPATGEVTLFNKTSGSKKLPAGTIVIGPNQLQFSLDKDITIASQSATDTGITFGKATTTVTAEQVGTSSNLPSNTPLSVKGFDSSTYSAKTNSQFAGGSSRQVQAVSKADHETLLEELEAKLTTQATDKLKSQTSAGESLIDKQTITEILGKKFTKAVGEEAATVSLTAKMRVQTLKFKTSELLELAKKESVGNEANIDFTTAGNTPTITVEDVEREDEIIAARITVHTQLIPHLSNQEIVAYLKGKYPEETESYLKSLPNFSKVEIEFSPKLPKKIATFPRRAENIRLDIKTIE